MDAGRELFVARGYHDTRIDDVVAAAGLSKRSVLPLLREQGPPRAGRSACRRSAPSRPPWPASPTAASDGAAATAAIRRWLRRYNATQAGEAAMIRVWVDAALQDPTFRSDSARGPRLGAPPDRALPRARAASATSTPRPSSRVALLGTFGARERPAATIDAAAHVIERGLLGR